MGKGKFNKRGGHGGGHGGGHDGGRGGGHDGGRGGRGGGYNGNHHNQHGQGHQNGGGNGQQKHCKNCGPNRSHNTQECFKNKNGPQNQQNRVDKNQRHNNNNQDNNHKHGPRKICLRCGLGHDERNCNAKEVDEDERCPCGNIYHRPFNCPWNQDPLERTADFDRTNGKICMWCKRDGDGTHDFSDCQEAVKFRSALLQGILYQYRGLQWCWHCSAENHLTAACDKPVAEIGKTEWISKINRIIKSWTEKDLSVIGVNNDSDQPDLDHPASYYKAPHPADYKWCVYCQEFGDHFANRNKCDTTEFDRRTPSRYKGIEPKKPYIATHVRDDDKKPFFSNNVADYAASGIIQVRCNLKPGCHTIHRFRRDASPTGNDRNFCTACGLWMRHPYQTTNQTNEPVVIEVLKLIRTILDSKSDETSRVKKQKHDRPSYAIPKELAVELWPDKQPRYDDLGTVPEWETDRPLFRRETADGEIYFNKTGNHQLFFPPILIKLTKQDIAIRDDDKMPINKAGRLGLQLMCLHCGTLGVVRDAEGDLVMRNVEASCTVGCGYGVPEWTGTYHKDMCKCITVLGKKPLPKFVGAV